MANDVSCQDDQRITRVTFWGMLLNLVLSAFKFAVGIWGGSQAVVADAVHSLSDMVTDLAILVGVRFWKPPADADHPYGHKKVETIVTLFIGIILGLVGLEIMINAVKTIPDPDRAKARLIAAAGPLLSIIVKEALYQWTVHVGRKVKSSAVIANAWHHRSDALSSIPAFVVVVIATIFPRFAFVDHIGAIIVAVFIFKVTWDIVKPAFGILIDSGASKRETDEIARIARETSGVRSVHRIRSRKIADSYFVDLHVLVDGELSVHVGHDISEDVKHRLLQQGPSIVDVVVHLEPWDEQDG